MKQIIEVAAKVQRPIKVLQFGEGNFLRAFADDMIDRANEKGVFGGNVVIVKPRGGGNLSEFSKQKGLYTVILQGIENNTTYREERIITCVSKAVRSVEEYKEYMDIASLDTLKIIISNTTEAGIIFCEEDRLDGIPPETYPGKLTQFLYKRFMAFDGQKERGLIILPTELNEKNGELLQKCVLRYIEQWQLPLDFRDWILTANLFCNTLVDRIVSGWPGESQWEKMGYEDRLAVVGEPYGLWVIETDQIELVNREFPLDAAGLPVIVTKDLSPYRIRKVRILNGIHTAISLAAYNCGLQYVRELMEEKTFRTFVINMVREEIIPTIPGQSQELLLYAEEIFQRLENSFLDHTLLSIAMNSIAKWKTRILPILKDYVAKEKRLPVCLSFSLAALINFYRTGVETKAYKVQDEQVVITFVQENQHLNQRQFTNGFLKSELYWGEDLTKIEGLEDFVSNALDALSVEGVEKVMEGIWNIL